MAALPGSTKLEARDPARARPDPTVSVVMPCYNGAVHVQRAIASVRAQTRPDFELIFVDDGSTDASASVAEAVGDSRITVLRQGNAGVSTARNRGLSIARGEYVAFLDADDTWAPEFLERMTEALAAHPDAQLAYCGWTNLGLEGARAAPFVPPDYEGPDKAARLLESCRWPIHAALTRREALRRAGGFDSRLAVGEDFLLWLEIASFARIVRVPEVLANYHHHGAGQASADKGRAAVLTLQAQEIFLRRHVEVRERLGRARVRDLTVGTLMQRGFASYWGRDLDAAHRIFRTVMRRGYGGFEDWKRMLPAILPLRLYRSLIERRDLARAARDRS